MSRFNYSFIQINSDFSQDHADAQHDGKESENNVKYRWEDEFAVSGELIQSKNDLETYTLQGEIEGSAFKFDIPNMLVHSYEMENGVTQVACSKSLIVDSSEEEENGEMTYTFYLTDEDIVVNPVPGIYISVEDFPEDLK